MGKIVFDLDKGNINKNLSSSSFLTFKQTKEQILLQAQPFNNIFKKCSPILGKYFRGQA